MKTKKQEEEIWIVNGRRFTTREKAMDYCFFWNFTVTDESTRDYFKTKVHRLNVVNLPEQH